MVVLGWSVLALVLLDEVLAMIALGVAGWQGSPRPVLVWLLPLLGVLAWAVWVSPRAPRGGPVARPVVGALVVGAACLGLVLAGRVGWGLALFLFSAIVHALAQLPAIRRLAPSTPGTGRDPA